MSLIKFQLSNATYDALNRIVKYLLPGLGTFYFTIAQIWGLPYAEQIVGTIAALATLLGIIIAISNKNYEPSVDGDLVVNRDSEDTGLIGVELNAPIEDVKGRSTLSLKVHDISQADSQ